jgi:uncharacterized membrane protein
MCDGRSHTAIAPKTNNILDKRILKMAKEKKNNVIIDYFDGADKAGDAADSLKDWDKGNKDVKIGGIAILTWEDGKMKTRKVGTRDTKKGAGWGTALGVTVGVLSGGVTLVGGALVGAAAGAATGAFFHKGLGLSDDDKSQLEEKLKSGGAALVVMATDDEVQATKTFLNGLNEGEVQDYQVPDDSAQKLEEATDVPPPDTSDDDSDAPAPDASDDDS